MNGEFWILFWATIGGLFVFGGLLLEKLADWMNENFLGGEYKPHKTLEFVGWCILMFGICIEIADAGVTAHEINSANPRNHALKSVSAVATIFFSSGVLVSNKVVDSIVSSDGWPVLHLNLFAQNGYSLNLYNDQIPDPPEVFPGKNGEAISNSVSIHLTGDSELRQPFSVQWNSVVGATNLTAGEIADSNFTVWLMPTFLRAGTVVFGGYVEVFFNDSTVERDFSIPPQLIRDSKLALLACVPKTNAVPSSKNRK